MDNVKLIRLVSGEDIIAFFEEEEDEYLLGSPMTIIFKRLPTGKALMLVSPWLPMEIIEDDIVGIPKSQVMTVMNTKPHMTEYYMQSLFEMENELLTREDESLRDASQTQEEIEDEEDEELQQIIDSFGSDTDGTKRTIH